MNAGRALVSCLFGLFSALLFLPLLGVLFGGTFFTAGFALALILALPILLYARTEKTRQAAGWGMALLSTGSVSIPASIFILGFKASAGASSPAIAGLGTLATLLTGGLATIFGLFFALFFGLFAFLLLRK